ncbi:hypothetical protein [Paenibacillus sp. N3.4]|uniref:hypothetical protein n=1 Tax=Paenibacillus sp. N3.4 TaxID=2603222 RepID=UPI001C9BBFF0|nr:hypothetical protein [Paenibacillus sp. N3.4]
MRNSCKSAGIRTDYGPNSNGSGENMSIRMNVITRIDAEKKRCTIAVIFIIFFTILALE